MPLSSCPPCDERTRFLEGFARQSVLDGRPTCYLTSDPGVLDLTKSYPRLVRLIVCHPASDQIALGRENVYAVRGLEVLSDLNTTLMDAHQSLEGWEGQAIACCDALSDILSRHGAATTKKWLSDVLQRLKSHWFTVLGVLNPEVHTRADVEAVRELFDGELRYAKRRWRGAPGHSLKS
ncbi:MAG: hypothetical protein ACE5OY_04240 [Candidatus Bathyarchaeia archaeon]